MISTCIYCKEQFKHDTGMLDPICTPCTVKRTRMIREGRLRSADEIFKSACPKLYQGTQCHLLPDVQAHDRVQSWTYGAQGLLLLGETGTGKTRSAYELLRRFCGKKSFLVADAMDFANHAVDAHLQGRATVFARMHCNTSILFLDDLGKSKMTDRIESELFGIIDKRTSQNLPVWITTQDTGETLMNKFTDKNRAAALIRRLREFCRVVMFKRKEEIK